jgi:hypothetical protein
MMSTFDFAITVADDDAVDGTPVAKDSAGWI